jgi:hypothetical protein
MTLPGLPASGRTRRRPAPWLGSLAQTFNPWALVALLLALAALWLVAARPVRQPLEGTVQTTALSFQLRAASPGVLAVPVRGLVLSGLDGGPPLSFSLKGEALRLRTGDMVEWTTPEPESFVLALRLPPGATVANLHADDPRELVLDLRSPARQGASGEPVDLSFTPPAPKEGRPGASTGLQAVFKPPGGPARPLRSPQSTFHLPLRGDARLRLRLVAPEAVFEPALPVRDVRFTTRKPSFFDPSQSLLELSHLRDGTVYFGRQQPLVLRANQFLTLASPGITELTDLRLQKGVFIVSLKGETSRVGTGLGSGRPTLELHGTLLSRHLAPDQISAFFGVLAGAIGSLVVVFFRAQ